MSQHRKGRIGIQKIVLKGSLLLLVLLNGYWLYSILMSRTEIPVFWQAAPHWIAIFSLFLAIYLCTSEVTIGSPLVTIFLMLSLNWTGILFHFDRLLSLDAPILPQLGNIAFFASFAIAISVSFLLIRQRWRTHGLKQTAAKPDLPLVRRLIVVFAIPLVVFLLSMNVALVICNGFLSMALDLPQAFETVNAPPPSPKDSSGVSIQINGIDGGRLILGLPMPHRDVGDSGKSAMRWDGYVSERLHLTPKKLRDIESSLNNLDPKKWEILTKLPSPIFRFDLHLFSDSLSPNMTKKISSFLLTTARGDTATVLPGHSIILGRDLQLDDISKTLASTKLDMSYRIGIMAQYMAAYDKGGKFVSNATGTIFVLPTIFTGVVVFSAVILLVLSTIAVLKRTLLLSKDFREIEEFFEDKK